MNNLDIDLEEVNDKECIDFILNHVPEQDRKNLTSDNIQFVLDSIYDFYEANGLIDEDTASDGFVDEIAELDFVREACRKEGVQLSDEELQLILDGELQYGISIGIYEEDD